MVLVEEGYGKMQVIGLIGQKVRGNKQQWKAEKQWREWIGKRNRELSLRLQGRVQTYFIRFRSFTGRCKQEDSRTENHLNGLGIKLLKLRLLGQCLKQTAVVALYCCSTCQWAVGRWVARPRQQSLLLKFQERWKDAQSHFSESIRGIQVLQKQTGYCNGFCCSGQCYWSNTEAWFAGGDIRLLLWKWIIWRLLRISFTELFLVKCALLLNSIALLW